MSLSEQQVKEIKNKAEASLNEKFKENQAIVNTKKEELSKIQEKLYAVEEKWISNQINRETYNRWYANYNSEIITLNAAIERYGKDPKIGYKLVLPSLSHNCLIMNEKRLFGMTKKRDFQSEIPLGGAGGNVKNYVTNSLSISIS